MLALEHIPRITSLEALRGLEQLEILVIHSAVGWDASGKRLTFDDFEPIGSLRNLEHLDLAGVISKDLSLAPLGRLSKLKALFLPNYFSVEELGRLARNLPRTYGRCLKPYEELGDSNRCRRCDAVKVWLNGKRAARSKTQLCPNCNQKALAEHVRLFEQS